LFGHGDDDVLRGGLGNDALQGSAGDDQLFGGVGNDALQGGLDDDALSGGAGEDTLFGGWGDDTLIGIVNGGITGDISDTDDGDFLNGGGGDDLILAGCNDIVTAGDGADDIVLGDWITGGNAAQVMDYVAEDDALMLVWDDRVEGSVPPVISVVPDPENDGQMQILMGDTVIARVVGNTSLAAADISLVALSSAFSAGLIAA